MFSTSLLNALSAEKKRKFEELLPELVKKLIISGSGKIINLRMPSGNDIWAPGFDGVIESKTETRYIAKGVSVWEFGTNADALKKLDDDYSKRTQNSLGVDKSEATFYLVVPKIWAYNNQGVSITDWENSKHDWKKVRIYDASVLCDWINEEPAACAWLLEQLSEEQNIDFSTLENAWKSFSKKTNPCFTQTMFSLGREKFKDLLLELVNEQNIVRIKSQTWIDAFGFCLSSLMDDGWMANNVIVVNNSNTYKVLSRICKDKVFLLNYFCEEDTASMNKVVLCFNKESTTIKADVELTPLSKNQYDKALKDMKIEDAIFSEVSTFTSGNLLSLIRRIPGESNVSRPKWSQEKDFECLIPLLFLRAFDTTKEYDRELIEQLSGESYNNFENKVKSFLRMEDSPVKKVNNYYAISNYEEAWVNLSLDTTDMYFNNLCSLVLSILDECSSCKTGYDERLRARLKHIHNLLLNYVYFHDSFPNSSDMEDFANKLLVYLKESKIRGDLIKNLSLLAEAFPNSTMSMIGKDINSKDGFVIPLFEKVGYGSDHCHVLFALDILILNKDTKIRACEALFRIYYLTFEKEFKTSNTPKESLLNALCLWNTECVLLLAEKIKILLNHLEKNPIEILPLATALLFKDNMMKSVRLGAKRLYPCETIDQLKWLEARETIAKKVFAVSIDIGYIDSIASILKQYWFFKPNMLKEFAQTFDKGKFDGNAVSDLHYSIRHTVHNSKKYAREEFYGYEEAFELWLSITTQEDIFNRYSWAFKKYYDCPFIDGIEEIGKSSYTKEQERIKEVRAVLYKCIREELGVDSFITYMENLEDDYCWGRVFAENLSLEDVKPFCLACINNRKIHLLGGALDNFDKPLFEKALSEISEEILMMLLPIISREDIAEKLNSEEKQAAYWSTQRMVDYNEQIYKKLLQYNCCGLLNYYSYRKQEEYKYDAERILEVLDRIISELDKNESKAKQVKYEIENVVFNLDKVFYSEQFAEISYILCINNLLDHIPNCVKRYFFYNPHKVCELLAADEWGKAYYFFIYEYHLPRCAYEDWNQYEFFFQTILAISKDEDSFLGIAIGGSILGRDRMIGEDGFYPHEFVRNILETQNSETLNRNFLVAKYNSRGVRTLEDGTAEFKMAKSYKEAAEALEIDFPVTASMLRDISEEHFREGKRDQTISEIGLDAF